MVEDTSVAGTFATAQQKPGGSRVQIADDTEIQSEDQFIIPHVVPAQRPAVATRYPWPDTRVSSNRAADRTDRDDPMAQ